MDNNNSNSDKQSVAADAAKAAKRAAKRKRQRRNKRLRKQMANGEASASASKTFRDQLEVWLDMFTRVWNTDQRNQATRLLFANHRLQKDLENHPSTGHGGRNRRASAQLSLTLEKEYKQELEKLKRERDELDAELRETQSQMEKHSKEREELQEEILNLGKDDENYNVKMMELTLKLEKMEEERKEIELELEDAKDAVDEDNYEIDSLKETIQNLQHRQKTQEALIRKEADNLVASMQAKFELELQQKEEEANDKLISERKMAEKFKEESVKLNEKLKKENAATLALQSKLENAADAEELEAAKQKIAQAQKAAEDTQRELEEVKKQSYSSFNKASELMDQLKRMEEERLAAEQKAAENEEELNDMSTKFEAQLLILKQRQALEKKEMEDRSRNLEVAVEQSKLLYEKEKEELAKKLELQGKEKEEALLKISQQYEADRNNLAEKIEQERLERENLKKIAQSQVEEMQNAYKKELEEFSKEQEEKEKELLNEITTSRSTIQEKDEQLDIKVSELEDLSKKHENLAQQHDQSVQALEVVEKERDLSKRELVEKEKERQRIAKLAEEYKETYETERTLRRKYFNMIEDMKGKIRVYCRQRPLLQHETSKGCKSVIDHIDEFTLRLRSERGEYDYTYDKYFDEDVDQEGVFEDTKQLVSSAVDGYNVCIFAYGQTGSGKTYTMAGTKEIPGITRRVMGELFTIGEKNRKKLSIQIKCYMLELYRDSLIDLFAEKPAKGEKLPPLDIKKNDKGLVYVQNAVVKDVENPDDLLQAYEAGLARRKTESTLMNVESSRSHLIFSILIATKNRVTGVTNLGKLSLVDLAGSERVKKSGATDERLKEAMAINKSLSALGNVISSLSKNDKHIPYRDHKLTMLMSDSIGGNAKTLMFVNISPADYNSEETKMALDYASRVKKITNKAQKTKEIAEVARLKKIITMLKDSPNSSKSSTPVPGKGPGKPLSRTTSRTSRK